MRSRGRRRRARGAGPRWPTTSRLVGPPPGPARPRQHRDAWPGSARAGRGATARRERLGTQPAPIAASAWGTARPVVAMARGGGIQPGSGRGTVDAGAGANPGSGSGEPTARAAGATATAAPGARPATSPIPRRAPAARRTSAGVTASATLAAARPTAPGTSDASSSRTPSASQLVPANAAVARTEARTSSGRSGAPTAAACPAAVTTDQSQVARSVATARAKPARRRVGRGLMLFDGVCMRMTVDAGSDTRKAGRPRLWT